MASSTIKKANKPFEVDTGISGVTAWESGNMVTLDIACQVADTSSGWKTIGTLPVSLRPTTEQYFTGFDNNAQSNNTNFVQSCRAIRNGDIGMFLYSDNLDVALRATVTYPTSH